MTSNEWTEWKLNQQTIEFFKFLKNLREYTKEEWANSVFTGEIADDTLQRNASALGAIHVLTKLLEVEYEQVEEMKVESKQ
jgi:hypothetical protein